jgi:serine/threonine-protein kinase ATR
VDGFRASNYLSSSTLPFAAEAAWSAGKWEQLERTLGSSTVSQDITLLDFNVGVGHALLALRRKNSSEFKKIVALLRGTLVTGLSPSTTASLQACHDHLVKLHALYEMEAISGMDSTKLSDRDVILENLDRRLDIIGAYTLDKQYLLGLRRAAMSLSRYAMPPSNV